MVGRRISLSLEGEGWIRLMDGFGRLTDEQCLPATYLLACPNLKKKTKNHTAFA